jgi:hypothetical protein
MGRPHTVEAHRSTPRAARSQTIKSGLAPTGARTGNTRSWSGLPHGWDTERRLCEASARASEAGHGPGHVSGCVWDKPRGCHWHITRCCSHHHRPPHHDAASANACNPYGPTTPGNPTDMIASRYLGDVTTVKPATDNARASCSVNHPGPVIDRRRIRVSWDVNIPRGVAPRSKPDANGNLCICECRRCDNKGCAQYQPTKHRRPPAGQVGSAWSFECMLFPAIGQLRSRVLVPAQRGHRSTLNATVRFNTERDSTLRCLFQKMPVNVSSLQRHVLGRSLRV